MIIYYHLLANLYFCISFTTPIDPTLNSRTIHELSPVHTNNSSPPDRLSPPSVHHPDILFSQRVVMLKLPGASFCFVNLPRVNRHNRDIQCLLGKRLHPSTPSPFTPLLSLYFSPLKDQVSQSKVAQKVWSQSTLVRGARNGKRELKEV